MPSTRTVGILGGMGPLATAEAYRRIVMATPAERDQDHLHVVIDSNPAVPDRTAALLHGGPDPRPLLLEGAHRLLSIGAEVMCIPCNTAHAYHQWLQDRVPVPIVHMLRESALAASGTGAARFGLLATTGTAATGLYQSEFERLGLHLTTPDSDAQRLVMAAINAIKADGAPEPILAALLSAVHALKEGGAEYVLVGCTELSLVATRLGSVLPYVDALDSLVSATVRLARPVGAAPPEVVAHVL
ncbi:aspartate/glutamate racemase family protein [Georgenia sp. H159]|uniref:aspartate/glutamate racemase family protein n=1 Tax=Georgenia sp. H159 TaxID=3076115 RepID=UPI002D79C1CB|nr:amino acid racemase [Georgenia sp. H159]